MKWLRILREEQTQALLSLEHDPPVHNRHLDDHVQEIAGVVQDIPVDDGDVRKLPSFDRTTDGIFPHTRIRTIDGKSQYGFLDRDLMLW